MNGQGKRGTQPDKQDAAKQKNHKKFTIKMQRKLVVLFFLVLLAFVGLSVRLYWISKEDGEQYKKQVLSQRRYDSTTLPYKRGDILDANGSKLATSEKVYNLILDAKNMLYRDGIYLEPTIAALQEYFALDAGTVREYVTSHTTSTYKIMLKQLTYDQIKDFQAAMNADGSKIKGVWFEEEYKRIYPFGSLACDVIGFTGRDNVGMYGLEEYYSEQLNGTTGREYGYLTEDSTLERTVKPAQDGYTIHSTIDVNIQSVLDKYLKQFNEEYKDNVRDGNGAENLGAVVYEVNTGNVLAMASYPVYDLNDTRNTDALLGSNLVKNVVNAAGYTELVKTDTVINEQILSSLTQDELYLNLNQLWRNYCIADTYEPGSTIKPFTVATALESGVLTGREAYECNGVLIRGGHKIHCHGGNGHGIVSVQDTVAWSCNVAAMKIGEAIGADCFCKFQEIFNFGLKTNIDLAGEARTAGLLYNAEDMKEADLATNSFGQNFNTTMIQMIAGYSALINGGYYYEPHVVDKITNSDGATVETIAPRVLKQVVSETTSEKIRQYCRATVMEEGGSYRTGKTARPAGYAIGGKTGTAQTLPRGNGEYVVSFIGHAPADDPQIAIYVVVDRPNVEKQDKASLATGIVRNILTEILPYLNIYMTEELSEAEIQELQERELAITTQYGKTPEQEDVEQNTDTEDEGSEGSAANGTEDLPVWMSYPIDPETGYRVDPNGDYLDAVTGEWIEKTVGALPEGI